MVYEQMKYLQGYGVEVLDLLRGVEKYKTDLDNTLYDTLNINSNYSQ